MQFFNPIALWGLLAVSLPIIIHYFNLQKLQTVEFPSLFFLKELKKNKIKKLKLKNFLLLLIRIAFIASLALAFARPVIKQSFFIDLPEANTSTIFIVDDTFSMNNLSDDNFTNFNKTKDFIYKFKDIIKPGDKIGFIFLSNLNKYIPLSQVNLKSFEFIANKTISYGYSNFIDAYNLAIDELSNSKTINKEIFILSDFQNNLFENFDKQNLKSLKKLNVYFLPMDLQPNKNLSLTSIKFNNEIIPLNNVLSINANIKNNFDKQIDNSVLNIYVNNNKFAQKNFSIGANKNIVLTNDFNIPNNEFSEIKLELSNDLTTYDNYYFAAIHNPKKINILIINDDLNNTIFLEKALRADIIGKISFTTIPVNKLPQVDFSNYNLAIVSLNNYSSNLEKLKNYLLYNKLGLIVLPGINTDLGNYQQILKLFTNVLPEKLVTTENIEIKEIPSKSIYSNAFENLRNFSSVNFKSYFKFNKQKSYLNFTNNDNFAIHSKIKDNNILIFASAFHNNWNDLPYRSLFIPLIYNSVYFTSNTKFLKDNFIISNKNITLENIDNNYKVFSPSGKSVNLINNSFYPEEIGIYKIFKDGKLVDVFSININRSEINKEVFDFNYIVKSIKENGEYAKKIDYSMNIKDGIKTTRIGSEIWPLFLLLSIILLILEFVISNNLLMKNK